MTDTHSFSYKVGLYAVRYRWWIVLVNFLLVSAAIVGFMIRGKTFGEHVEYMKHVRNNPLDKDSAHVSPPPIFNTDYHVFFDKDNEDLAEFEAFQGTFSKEDNLVIVVRSRSGVLFTPENLTTLRELTRAAWTIPYVNRVDGLSNFQYTTAEGDDLLVEDFIGEIPESPEELRALKKKALGDPLIPKFLLSPKADLTQISLRVIAPSDFPDAYAQAGQAAKRMTDSIAAANPDIEIKLGGAVMLNNAFQEYAMKDMATLFPLMLIFIIAILGVVAYAPWGSWRSRLLRMFMGSALPMGLLFSSVLFPICLYVGVFDFSLTNVSMNVLQMLIAVAIADSVHVMTIYLRALKHGLDKKQAAVETIEKNFVPCLITSITTSIGFFSLLLQSMPPFRDLGLFAGTGTLYAFLASILTLPAILTVFPFKPNPNPVPEEKQLDPHDGYKVLSEWIVKHQRAIRLSALAMTAAGIYFMFQIHVDSTAVNYFSEDTEFRQATEYIDENIIGTNPIEFKFDSGEPGGISDPEFLKKIERFQRHVEDHPELHISYVAGVADVVKRLNKSMHGDDPAYYKIPDGDSVTAAGDTLFAKKMISQYLFLYRLSLPQGMELTNQVSLDDRYARVTAFIRSVSSRQQIEVADTLNAWLDREMPEVQARAVGVPIMFGKLFGKAIPGMLRSLAVSLVLITLVLTLTFRSLKVGFYSMIPNIWPIIIIFGIVGMVGYTVNLSVAVVGMITLGIAVDDCVHFLVKYLRNLKAGRHGAEAFNHTYHQVGAPLIFTSIILVAGFGALVISDFALNSDLGMLCSSVIALALFADFVLLPAVILKLQKGAQ